MKYLFGDLDGTIIFNTHISNEDLNGIKKWRENGNLYYICTGRPLQGIIKIEEKYPDFTYDGLILQNGAMILDNKKNILYKAIINKDIILKITNDYIVDEEVSLCFESNNELYIFNGEDNDVYGMNFITLDNYSDVVNKVDNVVQMSLKTKSNDIAKIISDRINQEYTEVIAFDNLNFVDIVKVNHSKGFGVNYIQQSHNIDINQCVCIGDGGNDISMLDLVEKSYSFNHASNQVKNKANYIVSSFAECLASEF